MVAELYREGVNNQLMPRRRPEFESDIVGAEAAKLTKFSDAGGSQRQWLSDAGRTDSSVTSGIWQIGNSERTMAAQRAFADIIVAADGRDHYLASYSYYDQNIELEDGSFWSIRGSDMHKILNWAQNDPLTICPNNRLFGSTYLIQNRVTGETVEADLIIGPVAFGANTHWVVGIDLWLHRIYLEDGSYWDVRGIDSISQWSVNDTIVLGDGKNEWFGRHDSILINVNLNTYVYANRAG